MDKNYYTPCGGTTSTLKKGVDDMGDEAELIFDDDVLDDVLSKLDKNATKKELNTQLVLSYAAEKAAYVGGMLQILTKRKEGKGEIFDRYAAMMKGESEDEIRKKIVQDSDNMMQALIERALGEVKSPDFYAGMEIEMKLVEKRMEREDIGSKYAEPSALNKAAKIYLENVMAYAKQYGFNIELDEEQVLEAGARSKKAAEVEANAGYA